MKENIIHTGKLTYSELKRLVQNFNKEYEKSLGGYSQESKGITAVRDEILDLFDEMLESFPKKLGKKIKEGKVAHTEVSKTYRVQSEIMRNFIRFLGQKVSDFKSPAAILKEIAQKDDFVTNIHKIFKSPEGLRTLQDFYNESIEMVKKTSPYDLDEVKVILKDLIKDVVQLERGNIIENNLFFRQNAAGEFVEFTNLKKFIKFLDSYGNSNTAKLLLEDWDKILENVALGDKIDFVKILGDIDNHIYDDLVLLEAVEDLYSVLNKGKGVIVKETNDEVANKLASGLFGIGVTRGRSFWASNKVLDAIKQKFNNKPGKAYNLYFNAVKNLKGKGGSVLEGMPIDDRILSRGALPPSFYQKIVNNMGKKRDKISGRIPFKKEFKDAIKRNSGAYVTYFNSAFNVNLTVEEFNLQKVIQDYPEIREEENEEISPYIKKVIEGYPKEQQERMLKGEGASKIAPTKKHNFAFNNVVKDIALDNIFNNLVVGDPRLLSQTLAAGVEHVDPERGGIMAFQFGRGIEYLKSRIPDGVFNSYNTGKSVGEYLSETEKNVFIEELEAVQNPQITLLGFDGRFNYRERGFSNQKCIPSDR